MFEKTIFAKVFEPMSCGKPIIVGAEGETKKIVVDNGNAGLYFEPENAIELEKVILKLHDDPMLRIQLGENGRKFVQSHYSRATKATEYLSLFNSILKLPVI